MDIEVFLQRVTDWARGTPEIAAVCLVGSYARGNPSPSSDVDLILLAENPETLMRDQTWSSTFGDILRSQVEDWGRVQSLRVWYADGPEVEFGVTDLRWGSDPDDLATQAVIKNGYRALYAREPGATAGAGEDAP